MRHVHYSSKFKKDLKRAGHRSNDISILKAVIGQLAVDQILEQGPQPDRELCRSARMSFVT